MRLKSYRALSKREEENIFSAINNILSECGIIKLLGGEEEQGRRVSRRTFKESSGYVVYDPSDLWIDPKLFSLLNFRILLSLAVALRVEVDVQKCFQLSDLALRTRDLNSFLPCLYSDQRAEDEEAFALLKAFLMPALLVVKLGFYHLGLEI